MKIVLLKEVQNLGHVGDVKDVSEGYARNFLLKKGLARHATDKGVENLKTADKKKLSYICRL